MSHLTTDRFFDLIGGSASAEEASHVAECDRCRQLLEQWRTRLEDLRDVEQSRLDTFEIHSLRALYRELGPSPNTRRWVARLIRSSVPDTAVAVRGSLAATLEAYEAGPYQIVLQTCPSDREGRFDLHGQLSVESDEVPPGMQAVLTTDGGFAEQASIDAFGEFSIIGVPREACRLACCNADERIEFEGFETGEGDGPI